MGVAILVFEYFEIEILPGYLSLFTKFTCRDGLMTDINVNG